MSGSTGLVHLLRLTACPQGHILDCSGSDRKHSCLDSALVSVDVRATAVCMHRCVADGSQIGSYGAADSPFKDKADDGLERRNGEE